MAEIKNMAVFEEVSGPDTTIFWGKQELSWILF